MPHSPVRIAFVALGYSTMELRDTSEAEAEEVATLVDAVARERRFLRRRLVYRSRPRASLSRQSGRRPEFMG